MRFDRMRRERHHLLQMLQGIIKVPQAARENPGIEMMNRRMRFEGNEAVINPASEF